jgi:hypothetical protein
MDRPQFYAAQTGRRRAFLSQADARAYDAGWRSFAEGSAQPSHHGPFHDGWFDAYCECEEQFFQDCAA